MSKRKQTPEEKVLADRLYRFVKEAGACGPGLRKIEGKTAKQAWRGLPPLYKKWIAGVLGVIPFHFYEMAEEDCPRCVFDKTHPKGIQFKDLEEIARKKRLL